MHLIPLLLLASGLGGANIGSRSPSEAQSEISLTHLEHSVDYYRNKIRSALEEIRQIRSFYQEEERKNELKLLIAFSKLEPVAQKECTEDANIRLRKVREVLKEQKSERGTSDDEYLKSPEVFSTLEYLVNSMARQFVSKCFKEQEERLAEILMWNKHFSEPMGKMDVFKSFASFSLEPQSKTLVEQAEKVLEKDDYLTQIEKIIESTGSKLNDHLSNSCGLLHKIYAFRYLLEYGIHLVQDAASFGINLSGDEHFQYYCNYVLCNATRNHLNELEKKSKTSGEPTELQSDPMQI